MEKSKKQLKMSEYTYDDQKIDTTETDTTGLAWSISLAEQQKLEALERVDKKKYARTILKQLAYCKCMSDAFRYDSLFHSTDDSYGFLSRDMVVYPVYVIDSVKRIIKEYITSVNNFKNTFNVKNYSLFCLDLYESKFLDSLVRHFDKDILKEEDDY